MPAFQAPPARIHSQNSALHSCYWDWCRLTFPSSGQLSHHVIHDHVRKAKPMKKRDIIWMKKTDKSLGGSLDATRSFSTRNHANVHTAELKSTSLHLPTQSQSDQSLSTNLACLSSSHNTGPPSPPTTHNSSSPPLINYPSSPSSSNAHALASKRLSSVSMSTPGNMSFAQLSSPLGSPAIPSLPQSPALDFLVGRAIEQSRVPRMDLNEKLRSRKPVASNIRPGSSLLQARSSRSPHTSISRSSTSSQDAVERQLTQDSDMDVDTAIKEVHAAGTLGSHPSSPNVNAQEDSEMVGSDLEWPGSEDEDPTSKPQPSTSLQETSSSHIFPHNQPSPYHSSVSEDAIHAASDAGPSSPPPSIDFHSDPPTSKSSDKGSMFRSGALKITPIASSKMHPIAGNGISMSQTNVTSKGVQLSEHSLVSPDSHELSDDILSYPMVLLTQAPYQSQSQSQSQ